MFCGSSPGRDVRHQAAAHTLGTLMAEQGIGLVYGGAHLGLMGAVADAVLASGGDVTGVIPQALFLPEVAHSGLTRLEVVPDMHSRKARMLELCDGVLVLPGGLGTLEELFEVWTWSQLGLHSKPIGLVDPAGYYGPLLTFISSAVAEGYLSEQDCARVLADDDIARLLEKIAQLLPISST
ncbi:TIGR00730 family Rossman fold protein [Streptomyces sp. NPDC008343]|uniref:LOG family protein n=1 Tax=Streptomyces sp. NPDC008343 TaxID=3364828 RepID=UPI0036EB297C